MVLLQTTIEKYPIVFAFTLVILAVKLFLIIFLAGRMIEKKKENGEFTFDFPTGVFFLILGFFISRIFYVIFDFFLTDLNPANYANKPAVYYWQIGNAAAAIGVGLVLWAVDKKVLQNKFKGILTYIMFILAAFEVIFPINNMTDFQTMSLVSTLAGILPIFIPIIFLWLGFKTPGLRKTAWLIAFGVIVYASGALIVNEFILARVRDAIGDLQTAQTIIYLLFTGLKSTGLIMLALGARQFTNS